jgi:hypothetical protein
VDGSGESGEQSFAVGVYDEEDEPGHAEWVADQLLHAIGRVVGASAQAELQP